MIKGRLIWKASNSSTRSRTRGFTVCWSRSLGKIGHSGIRVERVKRSKLRESMPADYFAAKFASDRWFGLASLMCILLLISVAATYRFRLAWLGVPVFSLFMGACAVGWITSVQKASRYTKDWYASHPYSGPARKVLGPIRNFVASQPIVAGLIIGGVLLSVLILATFQLVPPDSSTIPP